MTRFNSIVTALLATAVIATAPISVNASVIASTPINVNAFSKHSVNFSIIKQQLVLQKEDIQSINLLKNTQVHGVNITLTPAAAKKLEQLTGENIKEQLQVNVGHRIISQAVIQSKLGPNFQLTAKSEKIAKKIFKVLS